MKHAVPNALHPLIAYQGVVLPYMLTGEIEAAIVFGLPTVGPAIVGSLGVGDVWVTATFMLVLATTLIIGNIISDMLLAVLDPRIRLGGTHERAPDRLIHPAAARRRGADADARRRSAWRSRPGRSRPLRRWQRRLSLRWSGAASAARSSA